MKKLILILVCFFVFAASSNLFGQLGILDSIILNAKGTWRPPSDEPRQGGFLLVKNGTVLTGDADDALMVHPEYRKLGRELKVTTLEVGDDSLSQEMFDNTVQRMYDNGKFIPSIFITSYVYDCIIGGRNKYYLCEKGICTIVFVTKYKDVCYVLYAYSINDGKGSYCIYGTDLETSPLLKSFNKNKSIKILSMQ